MKTEKRFPSIGWFGARIDRKIAIVLILVALLGWLLSVLSFIAYFKNFVAEVYDAAVDSANKEALRAASFLEGSGGDCGQLEGFLSDNDFFCTVTDDNGNIVYSDAAKSDFSGLSASSTVPLSLAGNNLLYITMRTPFIDRDYLLNTLSHRATYALLIFNVGLATIAGLLFYFMIISPIAHLRKMMTAYLKDGTLPTESTRLDEIGRLQNTFADMAGVLKAKEQSERRLIASISHDLKTPLTSILGYSQRLMSSDLPDEKREHYTKLIYEKGTAIRTIVDEFDDYLDTGLKDSSPMELMTARALCDMIWQEYGDELADAGVTFNISCSCPKARVICNPPHIKRYFGNLIGNSISHGRTQELELTLTCDQSGRDILLNFADNGIGVDEDKLQSIFEPLYTTDKGRKVSGLGLSICRSIITAHGGRVTAENLHPGLMIKTTLPCADM